MQPDQGPGRKRGVFVTATDTEVGKTIVASAIAASLARRGERVAVFKPVVTGLDEPAEVLPDHELLRVSAGSNQRPELVAPYRFGPAVSPHLAAHQAATRIDPSLLIQQVRSAAANASWLVAEGVGGLMVPLTPNYLIRDFALDLDLPTVVVARPGLGTINHTLLTVELARSAGIDVVAVVLSPWPDLPSEMLLSNRMTIANRLGIPVLSLPRLHVDRSGVEPLPRDLENVLLAPAFSGRLASPAAA